MGRLGKVGSLGRLGTGGSLGRIGGGVKIGRLGKMGKMNPTPLYTIRNVQKFLQGKYEKLFLTKSSLRKIFRKKLVFCTDF